MPSSAMPAERLGNITDSVMNAPRGMMNANPRMMNHSQGMIQSPVMMHSQGMMPTQGMMSSQGMVSSPGMMKGPMPSQLRGPMKMPPPLNRMSDLKFMENYPPEQRMGGRKQMGPRMGMPNPSQLSMNEIERRIASASVPSSQLNNPNHLIGTQSTLDEAKINSQEVLPLTRVGIDGDIMTNINNLNFNNKSPMGYNQGIKPLMNTMGLSLQYPHSPIMWKPNNYPNQPPMRFNSRMMRKADEGVIYENDKPILQNIVSTWDLKTKLDLQVIATYAKNTEYNPKRFAAAIMKIRHPKTTALIFASGKMVWTGAKSEEMSKIAAKKFAKSIKFMGFKVRFTEFRIQNIVGSWDLGFGIKLEKLHQSQSRFCNYEPEIFPGLIYRVLKPKVVVLVFVSGKIVLTGGKSRTEILDAYDVVKPMLQQHRKYDDEESTDNDSKK